MSFTLVMLPPQTEATLRFADRLRADVPGITVLSPTTAEDAARDLAGAEAAFGRPTDALLAGAPRLRWLQAPQAAPPPGFYTADLVAHPVEVTNMRGTYTEQVATHAFTLLLALARGLSRYGAQQARHEWRQHLEPSTYLTMSEATTLLVGLGEVGTEVARLLRPLGGPILAVDARTTSAPAWVDELHPATALDDLLPRADAVVVTIPHTPVTEGLFCAPRFARMKRGARFVNVGRGPVVVLDDLSQAVREGQLGGAALDVYQTEPLPPEHPLWDQPEVILTPHVASAARGKDPQREERYAVLLDNARRFAAGEPLRNLVDKASWF